MDLKLLEEDNRKLVEKFEADAMSKLKDLEKNILKNESAILF